METTDLLFMKLLRIGGWPGKANEPKMMPKSFCSSSCQFYSDPKCSSGKLKRFVKQCAKNAYKFPWKHCFDKSLVKDEMEKKYGGYKPAHL